MNKDPFDEFNEIEEMFREALKNTEMSFSGTGYSVSIEKMGNETKVSVRGDVSEDDVEMLKKKYPNAEITVNGQSVEDSSPVEVVDEEESRERENIDEAEDNSEIELVEEDEIDSSELALKRFRERKEKDS